MSWEQERQRLMDEFDKLNEQTSESAIRSAASRINSALYSYTQTAGINPGSSPNMYYTQANNTFSSILEKEQQYSSLIRELTTQINRLSQDANLPDQLKELGDVGSEIAKLEKALVDAKQDADTSRARQTQVEVPRQQLSWYQGFGGRIGFTKPLHVYSLPILVGFGVLLLFLSGLMLREFFTPTIAAIGSTSGYATGSIFELFTDSRFYAVLAGIVFVAIVLGILSWKGYFGQQVK